MVNYFKKRKDGKKPKYKFVGGAMSLIGPMIPFIIIVVVVVIFWKKIMGFFTGGGPCIVRNSLCGKSAPNEVDKTKKCCDKNDGNPDKTGLDPLKCHPRADKTGNWCIAPQGACYEDALAGKTQKMGTFCGKDAKKTCNEDMYGEGCIPDSEKECGCNELDGSPGECTLSKCTNKMVCMDEWAKQADKDIAEALGPLCTLAEDTLDAFAGKCIAEASFCGESAIQTCNEDAYGEGCIPDSEKECCGSRTGNTCRQNPVTTLYHCASPITAAISDAIVTSVDALAGKCIGIMGPCGEDEAYGDSSKECCMDGFTCEKGPDGYKCMDENLLTASTAISDTLAKVLQQKKLYHHQPCCPDQEPNKCGNNHWVMASYNKKVKCDSGLSCLGDGTGGYTCRTEDDVSLGSILDSTNKFFGDVAGAFTGKCNAIGWPCGKHDIYGDSSKPCCGDNTMCFPNIAGNYHCTYDL